MSRHESGSSGRLFIAPAEWAGATISAKEVGALSSSGSGATALQVKRGGHSSAQHGDAANHAARNGSSRHCCAARGGAHGGQVTGSKSASRSEKDARSGLAHIV